MKALWVGFSEYFSTIESTTYGSNVTMLEYDIIIINPNCLTSEYGGSRERDVLGRLIVDSQTKQRLLSDRRRRTGEIQDLMKLGRTVISICPTDTVIYYKEGSGPDARLKIVSPADLIGIPELRVSSAQGKAVRYAGGRDLKTFFESTRDLYEYHSIIESEIGETVMTLGSTDKVVSKHMKYQTGNLIVIPDLVRPTSVSSNFNVVANSLTEQSVALHKILTGQSINNKTLPDWVNGFQLEEEQRLKRKLSVLNSRLTEIQSAISGISSQISVIEEYKFALSGSGEELEDVVFKIFQEIGFDVQQGEEGRDDLILKRGDDVAVVEVKGVHKSSAERHAAQLEKWAARYLEKNDVQPKAILVVNAFNTTPLPERTERPFPNQMLEYSESRRHCLITSIQLLGLMLEIKSRPEEREGLIRELLETIGVYSRFTDYSEFIKLSQD